VPRPSVQKERKGEILDAFERCIIKYGVEGAGLQKIADEAGLARPLIRHHVGNREDLLEELVERFISRSDEIVAEMGRSMPESGRADFLLELLFAPEYQTSDQATLLYQALLVAAQTRPELRKRLDKWNRDFLKLMETELARQYPGADSAAVAEVALGIVSLYYNADSMTALGQGTEILAISLRASQRLLATLD